MFKNNESTTSKQSPEYDGDYSYLNDLLLSRGYKHSEVLKLMRETITADFYTRYPNGPKNIEVVLDEQSGSVLILLEKTDVTPEEFRSVATQIVRDVLLKKLKETGHAPSASQTSPTLPRTARKWTTDILFLGFNGFYALYVAALLYIIIGGGQESGWGKFIESTGVLIYFFLIVAAALPVLSVVLAIITKINADPQKLKRLLFFYEIPVLFISVVAIFFSGAVPSAVIVIFFFAVLFFLSLAVKFLDIPKIRPWQNIFSGIMLPTAFALVSYLTLLFLFYFPLLVEKISSIFLPISENSQIAAIGRHLVNQNPLEVLGSLLWFLFGLMLIAMMIIGVLTPFIITFLLFRAFRKSGGALASEIGMKKYIMFSAAVGFVFLVAMLVSSYQRGPGTHLTRLFDMGTAQTYEEKEAIAQELVAKEQEIREEFQKMTEARNTYSLVKDDTGIKTGYQHAFSFEAAAIALEDVFSVLAYPFVYQMDFNQYYGDAHKYFDMIFAKSISAEDPKQLAVIRTDDAVILASREIKVKTDYQDLVATVTISEDFTNTRWQDQEVIYEFSLPSDAAITGLKLGMNLEFDGGIAPRGAAGKVYQQQLTQRKDPALLEQTGPRQYRLRVFPIPSGGGFSKSIMQRVQFTYVVGITSQGYPLPVYSAQQNLAINKDSNISYYLNGIKVSPAAEEKFISANYLGSLCRLFLPLYAKTSNSFVSASIMPIGNIEELRGNFECREQSGIDLSKKLSGISMAVLYDASIKNQNDTFLDDLRKFIMSDGSFIKNNQVDYFLFNEDLSQPRPIDEQWLSQPPNIVYFGRSNMGNALEKLRGRYDLVIVAASESTPPGDIDKEKITIGDSAPIYIVYRDKIIPAYPSALTDAINSSGGDVVSSFEEALTQYVLANTLRLSGTIKYPTFGPYWSISLEGPGVMTWQNFYENTTPRLMTENADDPMTYLANKAYLTNIVRYSRGLDKNLATSTWFIDRLNNYAIYSHIVSPYSSLIALVNEEQQAALRSASEQDDRYSFESPQPTSWTPTISNPLLMGAARGLFGGATVSYLGGGSEMGGGAGIDANTFTSSDFDINIQVLFSVIGGGIIAVAFLFFLGSEVKNFLKGLRKK